MLDEDCIDTPNFEVTQYDMPSCLWSVSFVDGSLQARYEEAYIPAAYERLILDAMRGDQQHFVRR